VKALCSARRKKQCTRVICLQLNRPPLTALSDKVSLLEGRFTVCLARHVSPDLSMDCNCNGNVYQLVELVELVPLLFIASTLQVEMRIHVLGGGLKLRFG